MSSTDKPLVVILVSSANIFADVCERQFGRSFVYRKNISDPWGTRQRTCVVAIYFAQSYTFAFYLLNTIQNINRPLHLYNSIVFVIEKCYDLCN